MSYILIDTNVPIVANNGHPEASAACVLAAINRLRRVISGETLVLDADWVILREYIANLSKGPQPPGSAFFLWVQQNRTNPARCQFVELSRNDDGQYAAFPFADPTLSKFNQSDRVFVAAQLTHPGQPPIVNAVDSDWQDYKAALDRHGVVVEELCS